MLYFTKPAPPTSYDRPRHENQQVCKYPARQRLLADRTDDRHSARRPACGHRGARLPRTRAPWRGGGSPGRTEPLPGGPGAVLPRQQDLRRCALPGGHHPVRIQLRCWMQTASRSPRPARATSAVSVTPSTRPDARTTTSAAWGNNASCWVIKKGARAEAEPRRARTSGPASPLVELMVAVGVFALLSAHGRAHPAQRDGEQPHHAPPASRCRTD